eukprot:11325380-Prorocentrum_lima.AAC.1
MEDAAATARETPQHDIAVLQELPRAALGREEPLHVRDEGALKLTYHSTFTAVHTETCCPALEVGWA